MSTLPATPQAPSELLGRQCMSNVLWFPDRFTLQERVRYQPPLQIISLCSYLFVHNVHKYYNSPIITQKYVFAFKETIKSNFFSNIGGGGGGGGDLNTFLFGISKLKQFFICSLLMYVFLITTNPP